MKRILLALSIMALTAVSAHALSVNFVNTTEPVPGDYKWTYDITWTGEEAVWSAGPTPPAAVNGKIGILSDIASVDYFTIYDFAGFKTGTNFQPAGWAFQATLKGATPHGYDALLNPPDNAAIYNLTWYYVGDGPSSQPPLLPGPPVSPYLFGAISEYENQAPEGVYAYDTTKYSPSTPSTHLRSAQGFSSVPVPASVPEPSTFVLLGAGLLGAVVMKRRAKK